MNEILEVGLPYYLTVLVLWVSPLLAIRMVSLNRPKLEIIADKLQKALYVFHFVLVVVLCFMAIWIPA